MKSKHCLILIAIFLIHVSCFGQKAVQMVLDTATGENRIVEAKTSHSLARVLEHDIQISVSPNVGKPESTVNIHLTFGPGVNIDDVFSINLDIKANCEGLCNWYSIAAATLTTKAINKVARTLDFTMGGMMAGKSYTLQTAVFGLDGPPCGGSMLSPVNFQTGPATVTTRKMLLVINEEWRNTASVQAALNQYILDSQSANPSISFEKYYMLDNAAAKIALYQYIQQQYQGQNLSYLFFIGDNASTQISRRLLDDNGNLVYTWQTVTFTQYTMPLYQPYTYAPGTYDLEVTQYQNTCIWPPQEVREAVQFNGNSVISMGMVIPDPALSSDGKINYLLTYFAKLHKFRNKEFSFSKKVLLSDGFFDDQGAVAQAQANGRWNSVTALALGHVRDYNYYADDAVWKSDLMTKLNGGSYELLSLSLHGAPNYHAFGIYPNDIIYNMPQLNIQLLNLVSCNVGSYKTPGYLAGLYLVQGNVINVHAQSDLFIISTSGSESPLEFEFRGNGAFTFMASGMSVSDAYRYAKSYVDGEVILGDPLAKLEDAGTLPVVLQHFDARKEGRTTLLSWSTASETNSERFEIERSRDGKQWTRIGEVSAQGESAEQKIYTFSDIEPASGTNLYRLKMIDRAVDHADGTYAYSQIRHVLFNDFDQAIFPNPASDRISLSKAAAENVKAVSIIDMSGKSVFESPGVPEKGISVKEIATGLYTFRITKMDGSTETQKILIAR
jgi:hypothetical protein